MKGRIVPFDSENHFAVQLLLPWYVVERLDSTERARVEAHLADCPRCQADVAWQLKLRGAPIEADAAGDVEHGLAAMLSRVASEPRAAAPAANGEASAASGTASSTERAKRRRSTSWWRWAFALQFAATLGVALLLFVPQPVENVYHALGAAPAASANLIVVFRATATEPQIRQALRASDAQLVGGPTVTGAYLLGVAPAQRARALERLRSAPAVARVDSLDAGAAR